LREAPFVSIQPLLNALANEIVPFLDQPYAFFGHSLGGLVAFELARLLRKQQLPLPRRLFISSRRAAHLPEPYPPIHMLDDTKFAQAVQKRYKALPAIIQQDPELRELFLPILKADFSIFETYQYRPEPAFDFPITAFLGQDDPGLSLEEITAWQVHTNQLVSIKTFPGDHFYLQEQRLPLLWAISNDLAVY